LCLQRIYKREQSYRNECLVNLTLQNVDRAKLLELMDWLSHVKTHTLLISNTHNSIYASTHKHAYIHVYNSDIKLTKLHGLSPRANYITRTYIYIQTHTHIAYVHIYIPVHT
jgi:hypothetical protein